MKCCNKEVVDELSFDTNHSTLMSLSRSDRSKAITFYIAAQTPNKLTPEDRIKFSEEFSKIKYAKVSSGILSMSGLMLCAKYFNNSLSRSFLMAIPVSCYFSNLISKKLENTMALNSSLIRQLAIKYNFTVFDFAASKRDSYISGITRRIMRHNASGLNTNPL